MFASFPMVINCWQTKGIISMNMTFTLITGREYVISLLKNTSHPIMAGK